MLEITHWDEARDGPLGEAAMAARLEAQGYRVTRYVYLPGTVFPSHDHAVDKIDGVLAGRFLMGMHGEPPELLNLLIRGQCAVAGMRH